MLNNYFPLIITGALIIFYLWRISSVNKGLKKEIIIFILLLLPIILFFYSQGIINLYNRGLITVQNSSSPIVNVKTSKPTVELNSFERLSVQINIDYPVKTNIIAGAPTIKIVYPTDGQILSADTKQIIVKAEITDDNDANPVVIGVGKYDLEFGYNPITVIALDKDGHSNSAFIVVRRERN